MSKPSVSIPALPPNFFIHLTLTTLLFSTTTLATPFPKGGGGHGGGGGRGSSGSRSSSIASGGSGGGNSSTSHLATKDIVAIVLGTFLGSALVVFIAVVATNLSWSIAKARRFWMWITRRKGKEMDMQMEEGETKAGCGDDNDDQKSIEWDRRTRVGEDNGDAALRGGQDGEKEKTGAVVATYYYSDSCSEVTQVDTIDVDTDTTLTATNAAAAAAAAAVDASPEIMHDGRKKTKRSWRDRLTGTGR